MKILNNARTQWQTCGQARQQFYSLYREKCISNTANVSKRMIRFLFNDSCKLFYYTIKQAWQFWIVLYICIKIKKIKKNRVTYGLLRGNRKVTFLYNLRSLCKSRYKKIRIASDFKTSYIKKYIISLLMIAVWQSKSYIFDSLWLLKSQMLF